MDVERVARLQKDLPLEDAMPGQVELHGVIAGPHTQPLERAVEVVNGAGRITVDVHLGLPGRHLEPKRRAQVIGIGIGVSVRIGRVPVRIAIWVSNADADAEPIAGPVVRKPAPMVRVAVVAAVVVARPVVARPVVASPVVASPVVAPAVVIAPAVDRPIVGRSLYGGSLRTGPRCRPGSGSAGLSLGYNRQKQQSQKNRCDGWSANRGHHGNLPRIPSL